MAGTVEPSRLVRLDPPGPSAVEQFAQEGAEFDTHERAANARMATRTEGDVAWPGPVEQELVRTWERIGISIGGAKAKQHDRAPPK